MKPEDSNPLKDNAQAEDGPQPVPDKASKGFKGQGGFSLKPAGRKKPLDKKIMAIIGAFVVGFLIFAAFFITIVIKSRSSDETVVDETKAKESPVTQSVPVTDNSMGALMEHHLQDKPPADTPPPPAPSAPIAPPAADTSAVSPEPVTPPEQTEETLFSPVTRFDSSGMSNGSNGGDASGRDAGEQGQGSNAEEEKLRAFANADPMDEVNKVAKDNGGVVENGGSSGLLGNLTATKEYAQAHARKMPNPKYLLKRRTSLQCVSYTGIKTNYPGFVKCYLTRPLYSADGSVILAEAGAELLGEQSVELKTGQSNAFTSWTELETTAGESGVRASLNGLGTDSMGRSGTDAYIDNHYGQKFGGAVMLSLFKDVLATGSNAVKKSGNGYNVSNSEQNSEDMASKALDSSINIAPTGYVLPGTVINVVVAQDIDFSSVYTTHP